VRLETQLEQLRAACAREASLAIKELLCSDGKHILSSGTPFGLVYYYYTPGGEFLGMRFFSDGPLQRGCTGRSTYWPVSVECERTEDVRVYCTGWHGDGGHVFSDSNGKPVLIPQRMDAGTGDAGRD
jgi:hypothetical protein